MSEEKYSVFLETRAERDIRKLTSAVKKNIIKGILELRNNPSLLQ